MPVDRDDVARALALDASLPRAALLLRFPIPERRSPVARPDPGPLSTAGAGCHRRRSWSASSRTCARPASRPPCGWRWCTCCCRPAGSTATPDGWPSCASPRARSRPPGFAAMARAQSVAAVRGRLSLGAIVRAAHGGRGGLPGARAPGLGPRVPAGWLGQRGAPPGQRLGPAASARAGALQPSTRGARPAHPGPPRAHPAAHPLDGRHPRLRLPRDVHRHRQRGRPDASPGRALPRPATRRVGLGRGGAAARAGQRAGRAGARRPHRAAARSLRAGGAGGRRAGRRRRRLPAARRGPGRDRRRDHGHARVRVARRRRAGRPRCGSDGHGTDRRPSPAQGRGRRRRRHRGGRAPGAWRTGPLRAAPR